MFVPALTLGPHQLLVGMFLPSPNFPYVPFLGQTSEIRSGGFSVPEATAVKALCSSSIHVIFIFFLPVWVGVNSVAGFFTVLSQALFAALFTVQRAPSALGCPSEASTGGFPLRLPFFLPPISHLHTSSWRVWDVQHTSLNSFSLSLLYLLGAGLFFMHLSPPQAIASLIV